MEGSRKDFLKKRAIPQFKRKGGPRKGIWQNFNHEVSSEDSHSSETVYRILCQSRKIGSVIGKGGGIIKALRDETQAKITVADSVPGSDERVIIILSPSNKSSRRENDDNLDHVTSTEKDDNVMKLHCAAQDALLRVHDRIVEEDLGGSEIGEGNEVVVTARLLVPNNVVGCLLGRKGDVIQRLRSETGANIRVLPADHLPSCAMSTDELVQISGKQAVAKKALYEVSTLLHQNPRKDKPPSSFALAYGTQNSPAGPPMANMLPSRNSAWSPHNPSEHGVPMPWAERYSNHPSGLGPTDFDGFHPPHGGEAPCEFSMKILCSAAKIGGVIGKGGFNVKQLQLETGASIQVENVSPDSDERVIRVSSFEVLWNPRSQTIDAILHLQNRSSEVNEKGIIVTRLLVPSSKVGCILGQGGHVINEMRRRTQADIRVFSKEDKPKCASDDEELVQVSGNLGVAKDALAEIASRLRTRCLRDVNAKGEPGTNLPGAGPPPGRGPPPSGAIGAGSLGRYEHYKDAVREYDTPNYAVPPRAMGYPGINSDTRIHKLGQDGPTMAEISGTRMRLQDHQSGGFERLRGSSAHLNVAQSTFEEYGSLAGHRNPQRDPYQSYTAQLGVYQSGNPSQDPYQNFNPREAPYQNINPREAPYQNINPRQAPYQDINTQQAPYQNISAQGSFQY